MPPAGERGRGRSVQPAAAATRAKKKAVTASPAGSRVSKPAVKKSAALALKSKAPKKATTKDHIKYMSPKGKDYPPIQPNSLGNFLCVNDMARQAKNTHNSTRQIVVFGPSIRGVFQVIRIDKIDAHVSPNPCALVSSYSMSPTWKYQLTDTPIVARPLRASLSISNMSNDSERANGVLVLNTSSPLKLDFCNSSGVLYSDPAFPATGAGSSPDHVTEATFDKLWTMLSSSHEGKFYTANTLSSGTHEVVAFPCTSSAYASYGSGKFHTDGSWRGVADSWIAAEGDMPMSHVMLGFTTTPVPNAYSIECQTQSAFRYDEGSLLGSLMKGANNVADAAAANSIFNSVRNNGSTAVPSS